MFFSGSHLRPMNGRSVTFCRVLAKCLMGQKLEGEGGSEESRQITLMWGEPEGSLQLCQPAADVHVSSSCTQSTVTI